MADAYQNHNAASSQASNTEELQYLASCDSGTTYTSFVGLHVYNGVSRIRVK